MKNVVLVMPYGTAYRWNLFKGKFAYIFDITRTHVCPEVT
jgi:hypothetical protein